MIKFICIARIYMHKRTLRINIKRSRSIDISARRRCPSIARPNHRSLHPPYIVYRISLFASHILSCPRCYLPLLSELVWWPNRGPRDICTHIFFATRGPHIEFRGPASRSARGTVLRRVPRSVSAFVKNILCVRR